MAIIKLQGERERLNHVYYQVDSSDQPIGVGGMGQVFKGMRVDERTGTRRPVAIKFMYNDLPPQAVERARREASIQLRNDNLVEMLGFLEIEERTSLGDIVKHYHVVSELLVGVSLDSLLQGNVKDKNGQEIAYAVQLLQDYRNDSEHFAQKVVTSVLSGLMALHDAGYIHRDIDPSNIMVTADGHIKLVDFGIAKQMKTLTTNDKSLTVTGKFMGKPEYAAPELVLGDIGHQNQTTDIYAMGILLYQCIVGHTPFEGARHEILEMQLKSALPLRVIKNKSLRRIIKTACEKKQDLRYQSSAQMRVALETAKLHTSSNVSLFSGINKTMIKGAAAIALVAACTATAVVFWPKGESEEKEVRTNIEYVQPAIEKNEFAQITEMLQTPEQAQEGLTRLEAYLDKDVEKLSAEEREDYASAAYLLSRLCFKSKSPQDYQPDSIIKIKESIELNIDNSRAHQLLIKTLQADPAEYHALYELGCDLLGGALRTEAVDRDVKRADSCFQKALELAREKGDKHYIDLINGQIEKYQEE